ncbi:hypothetical protein HA402_012318 [Bradysia odoriphaga]|nr:hypothetical protein HA402_012318 [Bradysia odoriphaga]
MSSTNEFMVSTSVLRNESVWLNGGLANAFVPIGDRGDRGQSSTSGIDRNNVMFYNLVHQDAVGCWDTTKPYSANYLDIVARDNVTLIFPNDMKLDREVDQGLWVLSNRLPVYLYSQLDYNDVNFRIQRVGVRDAVTGTKCGRSV